MKHVKKNMEEQNALRKVILTLTVPNFCISDKSSIGMLHSSLGERNVGKSLAMDLLAKGQGVLTRSHPSLLAGGDQSQSGTSVYVENIILLISNYQDCCQRFTE